MADQQQVTETTTTPPQPPEAAPPQPPADPPTTPPEPPKTDEVKRDGDGKVLQVHTADFKKIKDENRERGRREALAELDAAAIEAGFESAVDAFKALGQIKKTAATPEAPKPPTPPETTMPKQPDKKTDDRAADKAAREAQRLADERSKLRKNWRTEEKRRRELQRQLDNKDAEMALREEAYRAGLKDVDFGLRLLTRELAGKSVEEVAKFDRKAFFDKLRGDRPYLFGETVVPATTGTNGTKPDGSQPTTPPAGKTTVEAAKETQFDARKATREQYEARLKELGLNPHMA